MMTPCWTPTSKAWGTVYKALSPKGLNGDLIQTEEESRHVEAKMADVEMGGFA